MVKHKWQVGVKFKRIGYPERSSLTVIYVDRHHITTKCVTPWECNSWTADYLDANFYIISNNQFLNNFK